MEEAWREQKLIGWDQVLKGCLSSKWRKVQGMFYWNNVETKGEKHFTTDMWKVKTIGSLFYFTLGLWNDCTTLHRANEEENMKITNQWLVLQTEDLYRNKDVVNDKFKYMLSGPMDKWCKRTTHYIKKQVAACQITIRGRLHIREIVAADKPKRRHRKKWKARELVHDIPTGETRSTHPYSQSHMGWIDRGHGEVQTSVGQGYLVMLT